MPQNCKNKRINVPFKSNRKYKKKQVCVSENGVIYNVHYGDTRYEDYTQHKDEKRRVLFRKRHGWRPCFKVR